ncbi:MAG: primosomal replication protein N [Comamonas sp.]|nr:primosomal replication protein N [Comamonas sp.]
MRLHACLERVPVLRQTPAGIAAADVYLSHSSAQAEAGVTRQVQLHIKAVAFGALAQRLARQEPGSCWQFQGFLASPRNSKAAVFHIQEMQQN